MNRTGSPIRAGIRPPLAVRAAAFAAALAAAVAIAPLRADDPKPAPDPPTPPAPAPDMTEATDRARLLHAAVVGALQVMHRDFFRRGDSREIPSHSLEDVFRELEAEAKVTLRWLAPDDVALNDDHLPRDDFEKAALAAFAAGRSEFSEPGDGTLRFAGPVLLHNSCLRCHVPGRKSLEDRFAALTLTIPVRTPPPPEKK